MSLTSEQPGKAATLVSVSRADGSEISVHLRLLGYDGCEFESDHAFAPGEPIGIHLYRMGCIRARIVSRQASLVEAEFVKECPV
jgi:hypothetical protein